jgi:histone H3/H4
MSAANAQNIWNAASLAQSELAQQSAHAAALRSDPLWYRTDEPLESISQDSFMVSGGTGVLSDQVEIVEAALSNNNMTRADVTPQAFACLLEQARRYALELLAEAQDYAYSANRHEVVRQDLVLAQELRADQPMADFTQLPRLAQLAETVNQKPLPPIPTTNYTGVVLPSKEHLLTARTFDVVTGARVAQRMVAPAPTPASSNKTTAKASSTQQPNYGASRGRQIPIKISQSSTPAGTSTAAPSNAPAPTAPVPAAPAPATGTMPAPAPVAGAPSAPTPAAGVPPPSTGTATTKRKADQM